MRWWTRDGFETVVARLGPQAEADIQWATYDCKPPANAYRFARETIYVICNSGMKNTVARGIYERVLDAVELGQSAHDAFRHKGKASAIDAIWQDREALWREFMALGGEVEETLAFLATLPFIGGITKYHLAKNFGIDCAKPDVHLVRLLGHANAAGVNAETVQELCQHVADEVGLNVRAVDTILWRACATGLIDSVSGQVAETT